MFGIFKSKSQGNDKSLISKLKTGLGKTRARISGGLSTLFTSNTLDSSTIEAIETTLLTSDVGLDLTDDIIKSIQSKAKGQQEYQNE